LVNREVLLRDSGVKLEAKPCGVGVSGPGATFDHLACLPVR
jgi:hypothetical protein